MMLRLSSMKIALLIGTIYSRISLEQIKSAVDEVFTGSNRQYSIVNPIFGFLFLTNGCVENMRFYSPELEIKYNEREERIYPEDKSEDSLTKLVIHLFPSHTGTFSNLLRVDSNFTYWYFKLCKPYDKKDRKDEAKNREANIKMLGDTFFELLKNGTNNSLSEPSRKSLPYIKFKYYVTKPSSSHHLKDDEINIKLLTLYAYALEELESENELKICLKTISDGLDKDSTIKYLALLLNDEQKELFKHLYTNPFKFPYSKINPPVSNSSIPVYDRKEDKPVAGQNFSDCADITILNLCNCLFYNDLMGECSLDNLNLKDSPTEPNRLRQFYEKYHHRPFQVTKEMRNDWSRVVQGLNDNRAFTCQGKYKPYMIHYRREVYRNEIKSGLLNTMSVLASICGFNNAYEEIMKEGTISEYSVVEKLAEFFKKIANGNAKVTTRGTNIKESANNNVNDFIGDFYITLDFEHSKISATMKLHISERHTSLSFEDMKSEIVEKIAWTAPENGKSDSNSILLSSLISRYIKLRNGNDVKTVNFDYPFEALYNRGVIRTNEQKRDQCIHLCEYMDKIEKEERTTVKKMIENIIRSANLSDYWTKGFFVDFFVFYKDLHGKMNISGLTLKFWISLFKKDSKIKSNELRNSWGDFFKSSLCNAKFNSLKIYENKISIDDIEIILQTLKNKIQTLKLSGNKLSDANRISKALEDFLDGNDRLNHLSIFGMNFESEKLNYFFDKIKSCRTLKVLHLSFNSLGSKAIGQLAEALENNETLIKLDISFNNLKSKAMRPLAQALENNETLIKLDISNNKIGSKGIKHVCRALEKNKALRTLNISRNNLKSKGIKHVCRALKTNYSVKDLDISVTNLGSKGIRHISKFLETNETLESLAIEFNAYDSASAECLCKALEKNSTLRILRIWEGDKIYTEFGDRLKKMRKSKNLSIET